MAIPCLYQTIQQKPAVRRTDEWSLKLSTNSSAFVFPALRIHHCDGNHVYNFSYAAAKLQDVNRFFHAEKDRTDRFCCAHFLQQFVSNVTGVEIWKDQRVCSF